MLPNIHISEEIHPENGFTTITMKTKFNGSILSVSETSASIENYDLIIESLKRSLIDASVAFFPRRIRTNLTNAQQDLHSFHDLESLNRELPCVSSISFTWEDDSRCNWKEEGF
jgi:hypothetical protein